MKLNAMIMKLKELILTLTFIFICVGALWFLISIESLYDNLSAVFFTGMGRDLRAAIGLLFTIPLFITRVHLDALLLPKEYKRSFISYILFYAVYVAFLWTRDTLGRRYLAKITYPAYGICSMGGIPILLLGKVRWLLFIHSAFALASISCSIAIIVMGIATADDMMISALTSLYWIVSTVEMRRNRLPFPFP
ncbi:MAG: hypothetical protein ACP5LQ_00150 [Candidatus Methanodesulfokora sp.]